MSYELAEFVRPTGNHPPGMSEMIFMCLKQDILVFPAVKTYVDPGDQIRIEADITFAEGDGFVPVYVTKNTVELMLKRVGQKDSRGWNAELHFFVPGLNAPWGELRLQDPDLVFLVKRPDCVGTEYIVLGNKCRSMSLEGEFGSGKADDESGRHGWTEMATGYLQSYYHYTGEVTIKPAGE